MIGGVLLRVRLVLESEGDYRDDLLLRLCGRGGLYVLFLMRYIELNIFSPFLMIFSSIRHPSA